VPLAEAVNSGIVESWCIRAVRAASTTFEPVLVRPLAIAMRRSIGRSRPAVMAGCGRGLTGSTDELAAVIDEDDDKLSTVTVVERHLSLRGPLSCCTAAHNTEMMGIVCTITN